jgi:methyl-accepting chemotaxis protein
MAEKPKRRLFGLLRPGKTDRASSTAADAGALWSVHSRAQASTRESGEAAQRIASNIAKQRGSLDSIGDRARAVSARAQDLGTSFSRVVDSFEKLSLVALNAGLEGARLGEQVGQSLQLVSEEVRLSAARGAESARELSSALTEVSTELAQVTSSLDRAREAAAEVAQEAGRVGASSSDTERALGELADRMKRATGSDPETAKALADAVEHGRAFVTALGSLGEKVPKSILMGVLRPVLEPLAKWVGDDEGGEEA